jgi:hypothetical protein
VETELGIIEEIEKNSLEAHVELCAQRYVNLEEQMDKINLAASGEFDTRQYDFVDSGLVHEVHENYEDIIEGESVAKYKSYLPDLPACLEIGFTRFIAEVADPAMKEGRKVSAKMRAPIRFDTKASS